MLKIALIIPSIEAGGAERVMTQLADYFSAAHNAKVHLLLMIKADRFYQVSENVIIHEPVFDYNSFSRLNFTLRIMAYLRGKVIEIAPDVALSFGGRYNGFVLLTTMFLKIPVFISDRSRPSISYGKLLDFCNKVIYKRAAGIIAQTQLARELTYQRTGNQNIKVIGNPIREIKKTAQSRKSIILNVGRFIYSKQQMILLEMFAKIRPIGWSLVFVGDGPQLNSVKARASELAICRQVIFAGRKKNVDTYYHSAEIFAFTSISEGFPNALGEAMNTPLACISFDCEAGPADLIDDGDNGFLIPVNNLELYEKRLRQLIADDNLRKRFRKSAMNKMTQFSLESIGEQYFQFLLGNKHSNKFTPGFNGDI